MKEYDDQELRERLEALEYRLTQMDRIARDREIEEDEDIEEELKWSVENPLTGKGPRRNTDVR